MEDLLDTRGIGLGLRVVWWGGEMKHTVCGTQFGKQSEIVFDFSDVFVGIGPRFTAVEPSRGVPQCLQGVRVRPWISNSVLFQCISKALLHTLTHCVSDSACYATPQHPLHPCLCTCHLHLFVCLFTF